MIEVGGKQWPCRLTMGAMLLFKRNMQKDASQINGDDMEELLMFMWCCIVSASRADGLEFDLPFDLFCDMVTPADMARWSEAINQAGEDEKKKEAANLQ